MPKITAASAMKVQALLGPDFEVLELEESTRTAREAAEALGCEEAQIAKSLVFETLREAQCVLVVASGANRVDEKKVAAMIGDKIKRARPEFVRERTGFAIGGVPPVGSSPATRVLLDEDLLEWRQIWAAAGTPSAVFRLEPRDLERLTGAQFVDVAKR